MCISSLILHLHQQTGVWGLRAQDRTSPDLRRSSFNDNLLVYLNVFQRFDIVFNTSRILIFLPVPSLKNAFSRLSRLVAAIRFGCDMLLDRPPHCILLVGSAETTVSPF